MQSPVMWIIIAGFSGGFIIMAHGALGAGALVSLLSCLVGIAVYNLAPSK